MYQSVGANDDLVITDASSWFFDGCGLTDGQHLPGVVQGEYDRYVPASPVRATSTSWPTHRLPGQGNWSDITYYTASGGGGVLATGMASFVNKLANTTAFPSNVVPAAIPGVTDVLLRAMENLYGTFGDGPASATQPSSGNWTAIYQGLQRPPRLGQAHQRRLTPATPLRPTSARTIPHRPARHGELPPYALHRTDRSIPPPAGVRASGRRWWPPHPLVAGGRGRRVAGGGRLLLARPPPTGQPTTTTTKHHHHASTAQRPTAPSPGRRCPAAVPSPSARPWR